MHCPLHKTIAFEAAQRLSEHLLRNPADLALERSVTHGTAGKNLDCERGPFVRNPVKHQPGWTTRIEHRGT